ncbi:MAG: hypothetical protein ACK4P2_04635 [Hyphomonas sp.]
MQTQHALMSLVLAAGLAACGPVPTAPEPEPLPVVPPVTDGAYASAGVGAGPAQADPLALTPFTPATNEIYCSFYTIGDDGRRGDLVFVTEIAGVPAPAHVGLEGQGVALTQVSKVADAAPQLWIYENADRGLLVEMRVTETAKGFESRDYEGTIEVTRPQERPLVAVSGTCGV